MIIDGKNITAIASDLDGTLLGHSTTALPEGVTETVHELVKRGVHFIAASGRQYENMAKLFAPVKDEIYFVCENGSIVIYRDKVIFEDCIEENTALALIADIPQYLGDIDTIVSCDGSVYGLTSQADFVNMWNEQRSQCFRMVDDFSLITGKKNKISVRFRSGNVAEGDALRQKYSDRLMIVDAGDGWLDFTSKTASKGSGLVYLKENVFGGDTAYASLGDSENDISMFTVSAVSYAMERGNAAVKAAADHVIADAGELLKELL